MLNVTDDEVTLIKMKAAQAEVLNEQIQVKKVEMGPCLTAMKCSLFAVFPVFP